MKCDNYFCNNSIPTEINGNSKILFIGEAPGATEEKESKVFCGKSGKVLRKIIEKSEINFRPRKTSQNDLSDNIG